MTDLDKYKAKLEEWKKAREAATQGEWVQEKYSADGTNDPMPNVYCNGKHLAGLTYFSRTPEENCLNAKFIALSANHWTDLIEDLEAAIEALEWARSCFSCIRHNCKPDAFILALDISSQVVMRHIDYSEKLAKETLEKITKRGVE